MPRFRQRNAFSNDRGKENTKSGSAYGISRSVLKKVPDILSGAQQSNSSTASSLHHTKRVPLGGIQQTSPSDERLHHCPERESLPDTSALAVSIEGSGQGCLSWSTLPFRRGTGVKQAKNEYRTEDFTVILDDILECKAFKRLWEFNLIARSGNTEHKRIVTITEADSDQQYGFLIDRDGLGGAVVRRSNVRREHSIRKRLSPLYIRKNLESSGRTLAVKQQRIPWRTRPTASYDFDSRKCEPDGPLYSSSADVSEKQSVSRKETTTPENNISTGSPSYRRALTQPLKKKLLPWDRFSCAADESSDEEQEPAEDVAKDENNLYEVERILARRKMRNGTWLYYIKWAGWPYKLSTWQSASTFENISEAKKEFHDRERALSVVMRGELRWHEPKKVSQFHSLMRWENEINTVLRANGRQILYIHNEVDYTRRQRDFMYITTNKLSSEVEAHLNMINYTPSKCTCETEKCGSGENCCPAMEKSEFLYTKRRRIRSRYYGLSAEKVIVECYGCQCSSDCPTKVLQNGRRYKVAIVRTTRCGWGLFALEDIPVNTFVVEYMGEVLTVAESDSRPDYTYQFELDGIGSLKYILDAKHYGNEAAFINHSCDPNLVAISVRVERFDDSLHRIGLFSTRRISRGQELTLNYFEGKSNPEETITPEEGTTECFCGAPNCINYWPGFVKDDFNDTDCSNNRQNDLNVSEER